MSSSKRQGQLLGAGGGRDQCRAFDGTTHSLNSWLMVKTVVQLA